MRALMVILQTQQDPFAEFRSSMANFLLILMGLIAMVSLAITIVNVIQGEREGAKKAGTWALVTAIGFVLIEVLGSI